MTTITPSRVRVSPSRTPPEPKATRIDGYRRVVAWASLGAVFMLVAEFTCRIEDWVMYRTPIVSRVGSLDDLVVRDADGMHARANAQFQKWKINGLGLRGPDRSLTPTPGTIRVITVGASETFGLRESPDKEYPRQLEDSLRAWARRNRCDGQAGGFEVLNAAFAGMSLPTIEQDARLRLRRLQPAVVIVYPASAQYLQDEVPRAARPDSASTPAPLPFTRALQPRILVRAREQVKQMLPSPVRNLLRSRDIQASLRSHPPGWRFASPPPDRLALFDEDLRRVVGTVRSIGAEPVLVTHANLFMNRRAVDDEMLSAWEKFYPRASGGAIVAFDSLARGVTMRVGADSGVVTVDAAQRLSAAPPTAFGDFVHFTNSGAALMADAIRPGVLAAAKRKASVCDLERDGGASVDSIHLHDEGST